MVRISPIPTSSLNLPAIFLRNPPIDLPNAFTLSTAPSKGPAISFLTTSPMVYPASSMLEFMSSIPNIVLPI